MLDEQGRFGVRRRLYRRRHTTPTHLHTKGRVRGPVAESGGREGRSSGSTLVRRSRVWTRWALGNGRAIGALSMIAVGLFQRAPNARSARSSDRKIEDSAYIVPDAVKCTLVGCTYRRVSNSSNAAHSFIRDLRDHLITLLQTFYSDYYDHM